ncbi:MAG: hypothetical protein ACREOW_06655 [Thermodesulfobacteriota bacterium]
MIRLQHIFPILVLAVLLFMTVDAMGASPMDQAKTELDTAIYHAKASVDSDSADAMKAHLKHAINCIEGAQGKNFDSSELNPCKGQGNGIIPDLRAAGSPAAIALQHVQEADSLALSSLAITDPNTLRGNINEVVSHLEEAKSTLGN